MHLIYDWAIWKIPDGCDVLAELSLDAHQVYSLSGGPWNVLTVEMITATLSFWKIPDGFDVSAELSLDAHQVYNLSGGP